MLSSFDSWFKGQFGDRERGPYAHMTDRELAGLVERGKRAAEELARRELWDAREEAALYAWQAREKKQ